MRCKISPKKNQAKPDAMGPKQANKTTLYKKMKYKKKRNKKEAIKGRKAKAIKRRVEAEWM